MFVLKFGPDPWLDQSSTISTEAKEWWDSWLITNMASAENQADSSSLQEVTKTYGLKQWLMNTQTRCDVDIDVRHVHLATGSEDGAQSGGTIVQGIHSVVEVFPSVDAGKPHRVIVGSLSRSDSTSDDETDKPHSRASIFDTGPMFTPLLKYILDMLLTHNQHRSISNASGRGADGKATVKRDRKRSAAATEQEKEKERGWPSLTLGLPKFGFGGGTIGRGTATRGEEGRRPESSSGGTGGAAAKAAGAGGVASWFGFGTDRSSASSPSTSSPQTRTKTVISPQTVTTGIKSTAKTPEAIRTEPKIISNMNMESLNEALVTPVEAEFAGGAEDDGHTQGLQDGHTSESLAPWKAERIWLPLLENTGEISKSGGSLTPISGDESDESMGEVTLVYTFVCLLIPSFPSHGLFVRYSRFQVADTLPSLVSIHSVR